MASKALFIRSATTADFEHCQAMDHRSHTKYVWQMDYKESNPLTSIRFQPVRLPRQLQLTYPHGPQQVLERWGEVSCFLVGELQTLICAYMTLTLEIRKECAWINDLVIKPQDRRRGHGSHLLAIGRQWAWSQQVKRLMVAISTKNYPAIQFYKKNGFTFCGYNEFWYPSGDIALFFQARL